MPYFRIIIPNYNNAVWLDKCLGSVIGQTFDDYAIVFIDDASTDGSEDKAREIIGTHGYVIPSYDKLWNGGARNVGLSQYKGSKYTIFLDSDDWFTSPDILQKLHDFIEAEGEPDCVRLPYRAEYDGDKTLEVPLNDDNAEKLVGSIFVACWTKCIKSELVQPFPENTLMEDVVQHIRQCDVIEYPVSVFIEPVVVHNKNNLNSCSRDENQDLQHGKWQSSMFRYMADLLDLELSHDYCIKQRDWKAEICLKNIKDDKYTQSVE